LAERRNFCALVYALPAQRKKKKKKKKKKKTSQQAGTNCPENWKGLDLTDPNTLNHLERQRHRGRLRGRFLIKEVFADFPEEKGKKENMDNRRTRTPDFG